MLNIDNQSNITLTRGDTAYIDVTSLKNSDGTDYYYQTGDKVIFRLQGNNLISKELYIDFENNIASLTLEPEDTITLDILTYKYEIELITSENEHFTFVADKNFIISRELEEHNGN